MTDYNRQVAELGEYGDHANDAPEVEPQKAKAPAPEKAAEKPSETASKSK